MLKTGQTPGEGMYECVNCGEYVEIEYDDDALPICPLCDGKLFVTVTD